MRSFFSFIFYYAFEELTGNPKVTAPTMGTGYKAYLLPFSLFLFLSPIMVLSQPPSISCPGPVKPSTPLVSFLERLQQAALDTFGSTNFDPKFYVDLSLKFDLTTTEDAFDRLPKSVNGSLTINALKNFIERYLDSPVDDLVYVEPVDFVQVPIGFLPKVNNQKVRAWALEVHSLWKNLSRKVAASVLKHPELHTLLPLAEPVIVPGSRFGEIYYWDSYWVVRLVLSVFYRYFMLTSFSRFLFSKLKSHLLSNFHTFDAILCVCVCSLSADLIFWIY